MSDPVLKTMYRAHMWKPEIEAVEIVKETPRFITIRYQTVYSKEWHEERRRKNGYYATWTECRDAMVFRADRDMQQYKLRVHELSTRIGQLKALKESP